MRKVDEIEQDIENLNKIELKTFRRWFLNFDSRAWDLQIESDAEEGKFDTLADEAIKEFQAGKATKR